MKSKKPPTKTDRNRTTRIPPRELIEAASAVRLAMERFRAFTAPDRPTADQLQAISRMSRACLRSDEAHQRAMASMTALRSAPPRTAVKPTLPVAGQIFLRRSDICKCCGAPRQSFEFVLKDEEGLRTARADELTKHGFHVRPEDVDMVASLIAQQVGLWNGRVTRIDGTDHKA